MNFGSGRRGGGVRAVDVEGEVGQAEEGVGLVLEGREVAVEDHARRADDVGPAGELGGELGGQRRGGDALLGVAARTWA